MCAAVSYLHQMHRQWASARAGSTAGGSARSSSFVWLSHAWSSIVCTRTGACQRSSRGRRRCSNRPIAASRTSRSSWNKCARTLDMRWTSLTATDAKHRRELDRVRAAHVAELLAERARVDELIQRQMGQRSVETEEGSEALMAPQQPEPTLQQPGTITDTINATFARNIAHVGRAEARKRAEAEAATSRAGQDHHGRGRGGVAGGSKTSANIAASPSSPVYSSATRAIIAPPSRAIIAPPSAPGERRADRFT